MRVGTWTYRLRCVVSVVEEDYFTSSQDINAKFSNNEQKRNGDSNQHEDKSWPVHSKLRAGRQRAGPVSFCRLTRFPSTIDEKLIQ